MPSKRPAGGGAPTMSTWRCSPTASAPSGAGDHHRRRLPLLRHPEAQVRPGRHPGHIQYTRNMVTGASTADIALILVDARNGVLEQTKRHSFLASLLQVSPPRAVCQQDGPGRLERGALRRGGRGVPPVRHPARHPRPRFVPVSALVGDNIVDYSNMPWYNGPSVLHLLEDIHVGSDRNMIDCRFPVQYVIRPHTHGAPGLPRLCRGRSPGA
jgi:hypothetical protein